VRIEIVGKKRTKNPSHRWYNTINQKNDWEGCMNDFLIPQLLDYFKATYGLSIADAEDLFETERNMLEYLMKLGRELMNKVFEEIGTGYAGPKIEKDGRKYKFVDYRSNTLHGLFGQITYRRAYYMSTEKGGGSYIPVDERLGIEKQHTPGCNYFLSTFTGREAYQESLNRFHEIFRPDGKDQISMRKALDMDYELGERIEVKRQQEIEQVFEERQEIEKENEIQSTIAVSIDATKVRVKLGENVTADGKKKYEIGFRDAKIGAVSAIGWDEKREEAYCTNSSYVSGIEHADEFFKRMWVEMTRRVGDLEHTRMVFLGDGAKWIWDRVPDLANDNSVFILDFYHACEHVSDLCKELYGQETEQYWKHFNNWRDLLFEGEAERFIDELKETRDSNRGKSKGDYIQGQINYFEERKEMMHYDQYIAMNLPIGSGTIESGCKNVIGGRMKQGGMTWSESGADGMLQIRSSISSNRFLTDFRSTLPNAA
jgi:hypothetical protein